MTELIAKEGYWSYAGVYIPNDINSVPHQDRANTMFKEGYMTFVAPCNPIPMNIEEYRHLYADLQLDGSYVYRKVMRKNIIEARQSLSQSKIISE